MCMALNDVCQVQGWGAVDYGLGIRPHRPGLHLSVHLGL